MNLDAYLSAYSAEQHIHIYKELLKPRLIEEKMLILLRQGKISKWFSGIGQEAISVGAVLALQEDEYILPMHRNLGVFTGRGIPFDVLFAQFQGKKEGFTKGRDRSFHFGTNPYHIVGMISHLGPQLGIADGIALAHKLKNEQKVCLVFSGDGGASEGDFHESLNVAAVWDLPVIFVIENNGYGLSTPSSEQFRCKSFVDKCAGYGMEGISIDGNNILEVYTTIQKVAEDLRNKPRPYLVECMTFRMRGHEEASGTKYVPQELFDLWEKKDPIENYQKFLLRYKIINESQIESIKQEINQYISDCVQKAFALPEIEASIEYETADVYAPYTYQAIKPTPTLTHELRYVDAVSEGLKQSLERHPNLVVMGQDVAEYGGVFKVTEGFVETFGKERIRNTPLCESAIIGTGLGLSIQGIKSVIEMQFADFVSCGFNQIVNNLAKIHYRWGQNADVVVRMPTGAGVGAGPFHSQSNEAWFFKVPGLKIVYPSNSYDAKGLLMAAIEDPNPVMYFEHKALYRSIKGDVPKDPYTIEIGKANLVQQGSQATVITYGFGVHWAKEVVQKQGLSIDLIDLRTLLPLDLETIYQSVRKTGKVIVLQEDTLTGGIASEISALITENCFEHLDAPVMREASLDTPVPFATPLENQFLPKHRFLAKLQQLIAY